MNTCRNCKSEVNKYSTICSECNFPLNATQEGQRKFIANQTNSKLTVQESIDDLKSARLVLFAIGFFHLILAMLNYMNAGDPIDLKINSVVSFIFFCLGLFSFKNPIIAILIALIILVTNYTLTLFLLPGYIFVGIIWKIIILVVLITCFIKVKKANKILKENKYIAKTLGLKRI